MASSIPTISGNTITDRGKATADKSTRFFKINFNGPEGYLSVQRKKKNSGREYLKPLNPKINVEKNALNSSTVRDGDVSYYINGKIDKKRTMSEIMDSINSQFNINNSTQTIKSIYTRNTRYYNRFKLPNQNDVLMKGFPHVFFVRPSCNLLASDGKSLLSSLSHNELFAYGWNKSPSMVKELSTKATHPTDFMMSLSNASASFSLSDEYIDSSTYGTTWTGYQIAYGRNNIKSKTAGSFTITFNDDRDMHTYQLIRLWVEYINGVYRGTLAPETANILNKILDYVGAVFYIVTAEDGETIIFWSKYYGVFPTDVPSSQFSWGAGSIITKPTMDVNFQYSFKEDYNPYSIIEFNANSHISEINKPTYIPVYDKELAQTGKTWVERPFIQLVTDKETGLYELKLRFQ